MALSSASRVSSLKNLNFKFMARNDMSVVSNVNPHKPEVSSTISGLLKRCSEESRDRHKYFKGSFN